MHRYKDQYGSNKSVAGVTPKIDGSSGCRVDRGRWTLDEVVGS